MPISALAHCNKKFTLKIGDLYLAPKPSIGIEEPKDWEQITLTDANSCLDCGGENIIDYRDLVFKIYYIGNGDLDTAWKMFDRTNNVLVAGCGANQGLLMTRSVRCETPRQYVITRGFQRHTDPQLEYLCKSIVAAELHLRLRLLSETPPPYLYYFQGPDV